MGSALGTVLPSIAVILSNVQLASPVQTALKCRRENDLGPINPVPWAVSFINCAGYMIYGSVIGNAYIMCSVTLGLVMNFFALCTALRILGTRRTMNTDGNGMAQTIDFAWQVESIVLGGIMLWILVAFICGSILPSVLGDGANKVAMNLIGNVCCTTSILYYLSPLSVLLDIIKRGDAAGLHAPLITLNLVATTMWSAYGLLYMNDVNVYAPNITAMFFSIAQLSIKAYYPSLDAKKTVDFSPLPDSRPIEDYRISGGSAIEMSSSGVGSEMSASDSRGIGTAWAGSGSVLQGHNPLHRRRTDSGATTSAMAALVVAGGGISGITGLGDIRSDLALLEGGGEGGGEGRGEGRGEGGATEAVWSAGMAGLSPLHRRRAESGAMTHNSSSFSSASVPLAAASSSSSVVLVGGGISGISGRSDLNSDMGLSGGGGGGDELA